MEVVVLFIQLKKIHFLPICKRPELSQPIVSTVDHMEIRWETTWPGHIIDHMVGMRYQNSCKMARLLDAHDFNDLITI